MIEKIESCIIYNSFDNPILKSGIESIIGSPYRPPMHVSQDFKNWIAILDIRTCTDCRKLHGKIYFIEEIPEYEPPLHERCRCELKELLAAFIGTATKDGNTGADVCIYETGHLPSNYITKKQAIKLGWVNFLGNLGTVAHDKVIGGDVYENRKGLLPKQSGRVWYEADINYDSGYRNNHRIIYSNDGLIFATYDHYQTFVQLH